LKKKTTIFLNHLLKIGKEHTKNRWMPKRWIFSKDLHDKRQTKISDVYLPFELEEDIYKWENEKLRMRRAKDWFNKF
jgi:hypothetical protein